MNGWQGEEDVRSFESNKTNVTSRSLEVSSRYNKCVFITKFSKLKHVRNECKKLF